LTLPVDDGAANTFLKSNGSGVTSWAAPTATEIGTSSGTASASTYLCGNNTWGTPGGGKMLQVVQTVKTDAVSESVSANTWEDIAGMSASITPATGSKVLVNFNIQTGLDGGIYNMKTQLLRGSTAICIGDARGSSRKRVTTQVWSTYTHGSYNWWNQSMQFLDTSPSGDGSTAITYKLQWTDSYSRTLYLNRSAQDSDTHYYATAVSQITLTEIGA